MAAWQTASGQDKRSLFADPRLVGGLAPPTDLHLQPGSPAIGAAVNTPAYVTQDFDGNPRNSSPDIGAFEFDPLFRSFGTGCRGSGGYHPFAGGSGMPGLGATVELTVAATLGGPGVPAAIAIGGSNQISSNAPLPLPLGGGCDLLVSPDLVFVLPVPGPAGPGNGSAGLKVTIPNDSKLKGANAYFQWAKRDPQESRAASSSPRWPDAVGVDARARS